MVYLPLNNHYTLNYLNKVENNSLLRDKHYPKIIKKILKPLETKQHSKQNTVTIIGSKEEYFNEFKKKVENEKRKTYWSRNRDVFKMIFDREYIVFLNENRDHIDDIGGKIYVLNKSLEF